ncbi:hypothetical protein DFJ74DRAFT_764951 [Hyaloraphidium curvatum]|nr:hypothetical protein DFJ74DRAFT_764951 [Hyaloraphidium curvatum]
MRRPTRLPMGPPGGRAARWGRPPLFFATLAALLLALLPPSAGQRTDFCDRAAAVRNGSVAARRALEGMRPTVAVFTAANPAYLSLTPEGKPRSGFLYDVLNQAAVQGAFDWNYVLIPSQTANTSDDVWLNNVTRNYDTVARVVFDTSSRRALGMSFTPALLEASLVLIVNEQTNSAPPASTFWIFLYPLDWSLWVAVGVAVVCHWIAQLLISRFEIRRGVPKSDSLADPPAEIALYNSARTFRHGEAYLPDKRSGRALYLLYLFFTFCICAFYVANLTSLMILQNSRGLQITSITDANVQRARVCFRATSSARDLVMNLYPQIQPIVTDANSNAQVLEYLQAQRCDAAVLSYNDWQIVGWQASNQLCNLTVVGPNIRDLTVQLPYRLDLDDRCTAAFGAVLSEIFVGLTETFVIQQAWNAALATVRTVDCSARPVASASYTTQPLTWGFLGGLFVCFGGACAAALVLHLLGSAADWAGLAGKGWAWTREKVGAAPPREEGDEGTVGGKATKEGNEDLEAADRLFEAAARRLRAGLERKYAAEVRGK